MNRCWLGGLTVQPVRSATWDPLSRKGLPGKILDAERRTGQRAHVVIELDDEMDRTGFGQTAAVRLLHEGGSTLRKRHGLRVAAFSAPGLAVVWSPIAERVDSIDRVTVNGIWMEGPEQFELIRWIGRMMGELATLDTEPDSGPRDATAPSTEAEPPRTGATPELPAPIEPEATVTALDEEEIDSVERHLREHPPRDFQKEKETEVYRGYVGFIEIHVTGASLAGVTTLAIPRELTELGLATDLRDRLSEKMRIDLSGTVDLGVKEVNRRVDAFREIFTRQMGPPLGRICKKSDWDIMQDKWAEIERLVRLANDKIGRSLHQAVQKIIDDAAGDWATAIAENRSVNNPGEYTKEKIISLLNAQWDQKQRANMVKVHLFAKDLTWPTLNDPTVRCKIEEAYPELCETGLYRSRRAWAS